MQSDLPALVEAIRRYRATGRDHMWLPRIELLMEVLWPVMGLVARNERINLVLFRRVVELDSLLRFVTEYGGSAEAIAVERYLSLIPGYGHGGEPSIDVRAHHAFLAMSIAKFLELECRAD